MSRVRPIAALDTSHRTELAGPLAFECPCGSRARTLARDSQQLTANIDGRTGIAWRLVVCAACGTGQLNPRPTADQIRTAYTDSPSYQTQGGRLTKVVDAVLNRLASTRLVEIERAVPRGRLLDVGCGKGRFVTSAAARGWVAEGSDAVPEQAALAASRSGCTVHVGELHALGLSPNQFDAITAWHVLEHLPEPDQFFSAARQLLVPNGILVVEVPNFDSFQARIGKAGWFQLDPPRHLYHYTRRGVLLAAQRHQFTVVSVATNSLELGPFGMLQSIQNRLGFEPNHLFRLLKAVESGRPRLRALGTLTTAALIAPIAAILELLARGAGAGGVLRFTLRRT
jgi:2-polyprenyl-3-methyl-5-hydroxy-6-metoxy-1,4-benzoquinol methylase